ncbi:hypothetical protein [Methylobacterium sp. 1030]|uniref:hypothetical protein n=1 Tax=Methylobacterium sp. 1030 TaxID=3156404 RepID=UPI00339589F8
MTWLSRFFDAAGRSIVHGNPQPDQEKARLAAEEVIEHAKASQAQRGKPVALAGDGDEVMPVDQIVRHEQFQP